MEQSPGYIQHSLLSFQSRGSILLAINSTLFYLFNYRSRHKPRFLSGWLMSISYRLPCKKSNSRVMRPAKKVPCRVESQSQTLHRKSLKLGVSFAVCGSKAHTQLKKRRASAAG